MQAIALFRESGQLGLVEKGEPIVDEGEVLVRTLYVGIDGSDRRIVAGDIGGEPPQGEDYLVLGHEAVGVVEEANGTVLDEGQIVAPVVRRPVNGGKGCDAANELDMAPPGTYHECGIFGAHGYLSEYFACRPEYLVPIPESLSELGFFVEPASIAEKALDQAFAARSAFDWRPSSAFVLGNGNLGLLGLTRFATGDEFDRTYCLGRRDRPDPSIDFVDDVGGTYVDSRETALDEFPDRHEPVDFVFETTGYPKHALDAVEALGPNGVVTLQGIPTSETHEIDVGAFHSELVVNNKAVLGVVNSRKTHFEKAAEWLDGISNRILDDLVTDVYGVDEFDDAFADSKETIKTVISFEQ